MNETPRQRLFSLPEYEDAQFKFVYEGVRRLMEAKDELLARIPRVAPSEAVPITQNTMPSGDVVQNAPVQIEARFVFKYEEIRSCDTGALAIQMDGAADQGLSVIMPHLFDIIRRTSEAAGTAINMGGKPFTFESWLDMLANMEIDFDDQGNPDLPTLVAGPDLAKYIRALPPPTAEQNKALADLMERKRKEHDARRRDRKLH
jgi:hypothetical protein